MNKLNKKEEKIRLLLSKKQKCLEIAKKLESEIQELENSDKDLIQVGNCYQSKRDSQVRAMITKYEKDSKMMEYVIIKEQTCILNSVVSIEYKQNVKDAFIVERYKLISKEEFEILYNNAKNNVISALSKFNIT